MITHPIFPTLHLVNHPPYDPTLHLVILHLVITHPTLPILHLVITHPTLPILHLVITHLSITHYVEERVCVCVCVPSSDHPPHTAYSPPSDHPPYTAYPPPSDHPPILHYPPCGRESVCVCSVRPGMGWGLVCHHSLEQVTVVTLHTHTLSPES